jgi:hypothetical protein
VKCPERVDDVRIGDGFGHRACRVSGEYVIDYGPKRWFIGYLAGGG